MPFDRKEHWNKIYETKQQDEMSWFQPKPETSLDFIHKFNIPKDAKIIDIGGGDSLLADYLLKEGFTDITVLDISEAAIERAKQRLGVAASKIRWIVDDAARHKHDEMYDFWHDRAAFHFLTDENEIKAYLNCARESMKMNGIMLIGTFSENGPDKCSGIEIRKYSESAMTQKLETYFEKVRCVKIDHKTPFGTVQNFIFCSFIKR